ncbi:MAG: hypothetical protein GEU89_09335 [Kiloniellaceae bacterium]|nr:hypothetical protein [Kiloniellaceae bacterium]
MLKRAPQSFRLAALAALAGTAAGLVALCPGQSRAEGYLATRPIELETLVLGADMIGLEAEFFFVPVRPGTYELYANGWKEISTVVTINVK